MFINYLKTAIRNIWKHKTYSLINILGLAIGLALFSLTTGFTIFQLGFNKFHQDADRIYCVVQVLPSGETGERHSAWTRSPLRKLLKDEFPEIEDATRWIYTGRTVVRHGDRKFYTEEGKIWIVDPNFLTFFTFEMISGNPQTALKEPNSIILAESTALNYFESLDVVGKKLTLWDNLELVVKGVTRDAPANSSLKYGALVSSDIYDWDTNWDISGATYVILSEHTRPDQLEKKFPAFISAYLAESPGRPKNLYLLALTDLNFHPSHILGLWNMELPQILYLTLAIGILALLAVCFNFMNLATAQYFTRAREVGVRKVVGASRNQLIGQFLGESVLLSFTAFPIALIINELMRPLFDYLITSDANRAGPDIWSDPFLILLLFSITLLVGFIAGSYPAFILSRLAPVQVFKGNLLSGRKAALVRQLLIILQFVAAIFFVNATLTAFNQHNYLLEFDVGFQKSEVLIIPLGTRYTNADLRPLIADLKQHPDIRNVSAAAWVPVSWGSEAQVIIEGADNMNETWTMNTYAIDYDFLEVLALTLVQGRSLARKQGDSMSVIINQTAVRELKWENPIGQKLTFRGRTAVVVGVVDDFYFKNLLFRIYPSILYIEPNYLNYLYIKLSDAPLSRVINFIENRWQIFSPDIPLEYFWLADRYEKRLLGIKKWAALAAIIGIVTILFSCLGLYGLASYVTRRRTKEIGIRKAHGATVINITRLVAKEFFKLVAFGVALAWVVYYIFDQILIDDIFAYSARTGPGIYLLASMVAMIPGLAAVLIQTIKAASANPIDALRYE
ncbi:MAG: FtsX-like permease family protein [Desulfobacterales bacterium]|nr:FtsX-like permease family protein [Desulfobacterales bacterium]